ncbi:MAG: hypothetical protein JW793_05170 [Acidobacteria bacterium]|nr:hypothetical protein [Acidobacteriota bacterium]
MRFAACFFVILCLIAIPEGAPAQSGSSSLPAIHGLLLLSDDDSPPVSPWSKSYGHGGTYAEYHTYGLDATAEGGVVFSAESSYGGRGGYDFWVVRLNADGAVAWERGIGGPSDDHAKAVRQTSDGGFILAGDSYSFRTGDHYCDIWVVKFDGSGEIDWQHTYGGTHTDVPADVRETFDGQGVSTGYILAGYTQSFGAGGYDLWILRLDASGGIVWQKTYGGGSNEFGRSVLPASDGGFLVVGNTYSFGAGAGTSDVWVLKLTGAGIVEWEKTLGGPADEVPYSVGPAEDGGYTIGASTGSFGAGNVDFWALHLNAAGGLAWQYAYGGASNDYPRDLEKSEDGGYIMTGWTYSFGTDNNDAWVLKLDTEGALQWQKRYNKPYDYEGEILNGPDWAYAVVQTTDGGYALSGDTDWWDSDRNSDSWVFKIDGQGVLGCDMATDTAAIRDGSGEVTEGTQHSYSAADTAANTGTPVTSTYQSVPEVFVHCEP